MSAGGRSAILPGPIISCFTRSSFLFPSPSERVEKGIFVTRDRPVFFLVKCEMANFFLVNRDFHSSREA